MIAMEDLIDVERLRQVAREGTGRGIKVAILDTGVESDHPALEDAIQTALRVTKLGGKMVTQSCSDGDPVGHGTACAGIIHALAPDAEIHSLRVIGRDASGTLEQLIFGLNWAIEQEMDIINLSLGTVRKRLLNQLHELVDKAYYKGQIVVAAANNFSEESYPAQFASLVAVDNQSFENPLEFHYRLEEPIEAVANGIYVKAPSPGGKFRLFTGTSFACPHISGLVARLLSEIAGITPFQIKCLLHCLRSNKDGKSSSLESIQTCEENSSH